MKTLSFLLLLAASLTQSRVTAQDTPRSVTRIRVLSYNIHHGEGVDRKLDLQRIARVIASARPDIVCLQEVDQNTSRTDKVNQPDALARLTQMNVVFGENIRFGGGRYGNAVLSRFPILNQHNHRLPNLNAGEQRGVLDVALQVPGRPMPLRVLATHLDHRRPDAERFASAQAINALVSKSKQAAILAGDLNDTPESRTLRELETNWTRANQKPMPTVPVGAPQRQIDFVLFRPADQWTVVDTKVLDEAIASDHRAILAILDWNGSPRP